MKSSTYKIDSIYQFTLQINTNFRDMLKCRYRTFEHNQGVSDFEVKYGEWNNVNPDVGQVIDKDFVEVS